jgi:hypothetical protein
MRTQDPQRYKPMKISRRKFLAATPVVAGTVLLVSGSALGQSRDGGALLATDGLMRFSWDSFYPFINTDFTFGEGHDAVTLKLVDMTDSRSSLVQRRNGQENFVMRFQGARSKLLSQGTYRVNHFNLGDFDLFITEGGRSRKVQYYIAVINRVIG